jgi:hypothetical protein
MKVTRQVASIDNEGVSQENCQVAHKRNLRNWGGRVSQSGMLAVRQERHTEK